MDFGALTRHDRNNHWCKFPRMKCVCAETTGYERLNEALLDYQMVSEDKDACSNEKEEELIFYNDDGSCQSVVVERNLCASDLCQLLALKNRVSKSVNWSLVEHWIDLGLGKSRLKRANLFNRKLGLTRVRSTVSAIPGGAGVTVRDIFPGLACACIELERAHPRLYCNIARQTGVAPDTGAGGLLAAIGHQLFRSDPSWGKVVAVFSLAGGLAVDCVRQGHCEHLHDLLDGMEELLEDRLALWVAGNGGWAGLGNHCRQEDQDISFVEYLGIFTLVLAILLTAYIIVRFFVKFSML